MTQRTYLELCQQLRVECAASGSGPQSTINQQGEYERLVGWVRAANEEIQSEYFNWKFLWRKHRFITSIDPATNQRPFIYAPPDDLQVWRTKEVSINGYKVGVEEIEAIEGIDVVRGQPYHVIVLPDDSLQLVDAPDGDYEVVAEYYCKPQVFENDDDMSWIPSQFERLIIYYAMLYYANYENAPELKNQALEGINRLYPKLETHQLPKRRNRGFFGEYEEVIRTY
ncbi:hypothetical protein KCM76_22980 [Zooshikella marina]|uniref:phage adaptor protein n=1 Tax=Zooshikella ganghwensis TaxID=202772 RepID=UPI001BB0D512|nr:hypothetical protein [Zooshikella ganghwensis]MBU2708877.1 hypothetical protein [Zooshikella ganghwensis]